MWGRAPARGRPSGSCKIPNQALATDVAAEHAEEHTTSQVKPNLSMPEVLHKSLVEPIFLAYNRVSSRSEQTPLMDITTAAVQALNNPKAVDAVQLMHTRWWIYMHTASDRTELV